MIIDAVIHVLLQDPVATASGLLIAASVLLLVYGLGTKP